MKTIEVLKKLGENIFVRKKISPTIKTGIFKYKICFNTFQQIYLSL